MWRFLRERAPQSCLRTRAALRLPEEFEKQQLGFHSFLVVEADGAVPTNMICPDNRARPPGMYLMNSALAVEVNFTPRLDHRCGFELGTDEFFQWRLLVFGKAAGCR